MARQDKNTKVENVKGRYAIIVAAIAALGSILSGTLLCNKKEEAPAKQQKTAVASNQNSPVTGNVETQNNYYTAAPKDSAVAAKPAMPEKANSVKIVAAKKEETPATVNAPNANIVTLHQSGGNNTVVIADSYEKKLEALKNTPPQVGYKLYIRDSFLLADVELNNDVPVTFAARVRNQEGIPASGMFFSAKTLYPDKQRQYTFRIEKLYPPGMRNTAAQFKGIVTVSIRSVYYEELKKRSLWKRSHRMYMFDKTNQTITLLDEPASDVKFSDTTQIPWENLN